jgi:ribosomal protein L40E
MRCSRCQQENPVGVKFCGECGTKLEVRCSQCGVGNPPTNKFCHECGTALSAGAPESTLPSPVAYTPKHLAEKILTSKAVLEGERKQVTVLFADLKGSMELLADRDPRGGAQAARPRARTDDGGGAPLRGHREPGHGRRDHGVVWGADRPRGPRGAGVLRGAPDAGVGEALLRWGPALPRRRSIDPAV